MPTTRIAPLFLVLLFIPAASMAEDPPPIIDVHLHAMPVDSQGPVPSTVCAPFGRFPAWDPEENYGATFAALAGNPDCINPIQSPMTDDALMEKTLAILEARNIIGITSGPPAFVQRWREAAPNRVIPGLLFDLAEERPSPATLRQWHAEGKLAVLGEVTIQYQGITPDDPRFEPYLAVAEELDIPIGIHMGAGPPGAPYLAYPDYRARVHSPLSLEEPLLRHPDLRVYVMHAGWPMLDDTLALLYAHPHVYVGVGVIDYILPRAEFHRYLRQLVESGFGNRIMFGSDQMVWPEAIEHAIESIESADFLSASEKRDIFYNNAARFFRLSKEQIDGHHGPGPATDMATPLTVNAPSANENRVE